MNLKQWVSLENSDQERILTTNKAAATLYVEYVVPQVPVGSSKTNVA
uniref:Uncharacterized protein n=1 Tax=Lepeophtheirus salmonis TaxID=72036 RepID=A0A0K2TDI5_LEPSM